MHSHEQLIAERQRLLGAGYRLFYQNPLHPVRGEGVWLYDADGRRYLDAYNNVVSVGHCHPRVVDAIAEQSAQLNTHTRYLHEAIIDYADELLASFPAPLRNMTLTCSGSEANDLALRVAREITGGSVAIVTRWAYHGVTCAIAELSPSLGTGCSANVRLIDAPDSYRSPGTWLNSLRHTLIELQKEGLRPSALLVDTIFSSDGIFSPLAGEMQQAVDLIHNAGGLFIADEVQAGFARTGAHFWGFEGLGVIPDLVTMGKPMGNGHPVAGVVGRPDLFTTFGQRQRYFNTFGGNPVSCKAAHAVLHVIRDEHLQENAQIQGAALHDGLKKLASQHANIGDVRGKGLFTGVELVISQQSREPATELATAVVNLMREEGVLISATGPASNILKIRPPLILASEHVELLTQTLDRVLTTLRM